MPRIAGVGLAYSTLMLLLSSSAVPQEPARTGGEAGSGQLIFNNSCRTCHTTKEGDNRLGPNLHNIIGRKAGSLPNFGYSGAMKGRTSFGTRKNSTASSRNLMRSCRATT